MNGHTTPPQHTQPQPQPQPTTVDQAVEGNGVRGVKVQKPQVTVVAERLFGLTVFFVVCPWFFCVSKNDGQTKNTVICCVLTVTGTWKAVK